MRVRKILVVDDTPANLIAAEAALAPLALPIVTAASGEEALARLLEEEFALILLDVQMPGMDGYETARWIRSRERTEHVPIIFTTAHDYDHSSVLRAYALGAVDFLPKPIITEVLLAKAGMFVLLQERSEELAAERMEREFENRRRDYETLALRRERDREHAAKQELARLNSALEESDRRKDSFLAILAHELRNPLAPIRTCIDLVSADPERRLDDRMLAILDRQASLLARLVDDLLDLSRIKADKLELRPEHVDLADVVEGALVTSRPLIGDRNHALVFEPPGHPIPVIVDTVRFVQVLSNLVNNAARYTPRGGRITIECGIVGELASVRVTDNGVGIPQELQETIFRMFVQERVGSDGSGGLGLGLALSRRLVEMHHGTISVCSEGRGHGSTFEVRVPLAGTAPALVPRKRTREIPRLPETQAPASIRTVVIDDNEDAREMIATLLTAKGYQVSSASDGPSGIALIRAERPHVALVDLGLPGLDGLGIARALRAESPDLATRLVALTGYGEDSDLARSRQAGFHAHLVKPASAEAILECLARQLAHVEPRDTVR